MKQIIYDEGLEKKLKIACEHVFDLNEINLMDVRKTLKNKYGKNYQFYSFTGFDENSEQNKYAIFSIWSQ